MSLLPRILLLACLTACALVGHAPAEQTRTMVVVDGEQIVVNGQAEIPAALFGVHATALNPQVIEELGIEATRQIHFVPKPTVQALDKQGRLRSPYDRLEMVIDCLGDRYFPALVLTRSDFRRHCRKIGQEYAEKCKQAGYPGVLEFWNEPYLNWASRSRKNYQRRFFDVSTARQDGKVTIKGWDEPLDHLRWRNLWAAGPDGKIAWGVAVPAGLKPGQTFRARNPPQWYWTDPRKQAFRVVQQWNVHDPTQVSWWSGRQNRQFYHWMLLPLARAVKQTNPNVTVLAGWDYGLSHDDWAVWEELYKPLLDAAANTIDGLTEHHFGVETRLVPVWYEVACAYTMARHGKWMRTYNTECSHSADPSMDTPSQRDTPEARAAYMLADVMELLARCPGKAGSRATHNLQPDSGEAWAFRLLRDLRGPMLRTAGGDPDIWPVAAVNGRSLVVAVFSNAAEPRRLQLHVTAPDGTQIESAQWRRLVPTRRHDGMEIRTDRARLDDAGLYETSLNPRRAALLHCRLDKPVAPRPTLQRRQFFAREGVLLPARPGAPAGMTIRIPPGVLAAADNALVQLAIDSLDTRETLGLHLNGRKIAFPSANHVSRVAIDPQLLASKNALTVAVHGDKADGIRVVAASILVDTPTD